MLLLLTDAIDGRDRLLNFELVAHARDIASTETLAEIDDTTCVEITTAHGDVILVRGTCDRIYGQLDGDEDDD